MKQLLPFFSLLFFSCSPTNQLTELHQQSIQKFEITNDLNPITVQVNVIVLQNPKKKKSNFDLNNPEEKQLLVDYFEKINSVWSHFSKPSNLNGCYTGNDFYADSKIRFKFNFISIDDEFAWNYRNSGADIEKGNYNGLIPSEKWYLNYLDKKLWNDIKVPKGISIYLTTDEIAFDKYSAVNGKDFNINGVEASEFPSTINLNRTSAINVPNRYLKYLSHKYQAPLQYKTNWDETRSWHIGDAVGTAHELGHSLGLAHDNEYHNTNSCPYSLMSQRWNDARNYLQPTEILKAHQNLRESNLIQFVTEDSFLGNTFVIDRNTTFSKTQRFYSNIKIADNVTLTISEPLIISPQATIVFGKNSKIVFEKSGKITCPNAKVFSNYVNKKSDSIVKN